MTSPHGARVPRPTRFEARPPRADKEERPSAPPPRRGIGLALVAAVGGGVLAFLLFIPSGPVPAILAMPFGASLAVLVAALALYASPRSPS